ncbi:MAG: insulinase family protein [Dehalococcoidia bacterium]
MAKLEQAFAGLPRGLRSERPAVPEPIQTAPRRREIGEGTRTAEIRLGWPVPGVEHPDWGPLLILDDLLSTTGRRLAEDIRDRRALASSVDSGYVEFDDAGVMLVLATAQVDKVDAVVEAILAQIVRLRQGDVTAAEVAASLRAIAGRRALGEESNQAQTSRARDEVSGTPISYEEALSRLRTVTPGDIQRVARAYLDPVNHTLVIVRP